MYNQTINCYQMYAKHFIKLMRLTPRLTILQCAWHWLLVKKCLVPTSMSRVSTDHKVSHTKHFEMAKDDTQCKGIAKLCYSF